mmetsp:Transcript_47758/g.108314  ORF Transcript_47758/g.108314 Transcript_47758/m.108314 type:complete len:245 (+) Transcript_47758:1278-2012(+)
MPHSPLRIWPASHGAERTHHLHLGVVPVRREPEILHHPQGTVGKFQGDGGGVYVPKIFERGIYCDAPVNCDGLNLQPADKPGHVQVVARHVKVQAPGGPVVLGGLLKPVKRPDPDHLHLPDSSRGNHPLYLGKIVVIPPHEPHLQHHLRRLHRRQAGLRLADSGADRLLHKYVLTRCRAHQNRREVGGGGRRNHHCRDAGVLCENLRAHLRVARRRAPQAPELAHQSIHSRRYRVHHRHHLHPG